MEVKDNLELIEGSEGKYIRFGGHGIIDGLKSTPCKYDFFKIIGRSIYDGLIVKGYRRKTKSILPYHEMGQSFEIIDGKTFNSLQVYND